MQQNLRIGEVSIKKIGNSFSFLIGNRCLTENTHQSWCQLKYPTSNCSMFYKEVFLIKGNTGMFVQSGRLDCCLFPFPKWPYFPFTIKPSEPCDDTGPTSASEINIDWVDINFILRSKVSHSNFIYGDNGKWLHTNISSHGLEVSRLGWMFSSFTLSQSSCKVCPFSAAAIAVNLEESYKLSKYWNVKSSL